MVVVVYLLKQLNFFLSLSLCYVFFLLKSHFDNSHTATPCIYVTMRRSAKSKSASAKGKRSPRVRVVPPRVGFEDPEHRLLLEWLVEHGTTFADVSVLSL